MAGRTIMSETGTYYMSPEAANAVISRRDATISRLTKENERLVKRNQKYCLDLGNIENEALVLQSQKSELKDKQAKFEDFIQASLTTTAEYGDVDFDFLSEKAEDLGLITWREPTEAELKEHYNGFDDELTKTSKIWALTALPSPETEGDKS